MPLLSFKLDFQIFCAENSTVYIRHCNYKKDVFQFSARFFVSEMRVAI